MAKNNLSMTLFLTNARAGKALSVVARYLADMNERHPFDENAKRAARALRYAIKHLECRAK
jgi:hypothetical protein